MIDWWTRSSTRTRRTVGASSALLVLALALVAAFVPGERVGRAVAAALRDPASVFASRSPGRRPAGALTQTKRRLAAAGRERVAPGARLPAERVLPVVRTRPAPAAGVAPATAVPAILAPGEAAPAGVGGAPAGPTDVALGPLVPGVGAVPIGVAPIGGGGGGGGVTPTEPGAPNPPATPTPPVTPVTPVPEPATWLSMILGLAFVGGALRRRQVRASDETRLPESR